MRLLHTADWHLGRVLHGRSMLSEQTAMVDRIVEIVSDTGADLVVIAGDIYDRAVPPADAVELFDDATARLRKTGARVAVISGNHDSAVRVGVYDKLLTGSGVSIRGSVSESNLPVMIPGGDEGGDVAVYLLPYLDPYLHSRFMAGGDAGSVSRLTHNEITLLACDRIRADLADRGNPRSVLVAHTFLDDSQQCESERNLTVGNVETVEVETLHTFNYVALGHLHGPQEYESPRIAYSGSPLPYSFSEQDHIKSVRVVDLNVDGTVNVEVVPLNIGQRLVTIHGDIDDLLHDPKYKPAETCKVRATMTDRYLPTQAMHRLRERFPDIAVLRHDPDMSDSPETLEDKIDTKDPLQIGESAPLETLLRFWVEQVGNEPTDAERELIERAVRETADR